MKQKNLFLLCGTPGAGKSTWVKAQIENCKYPVALVSRDAIRFSIIKDDEDYFSHETEVFDEFCRQIQAELDAGKTVYADATHLNEKSRNKTLDKLNLEGVELYAVCFDASVETCLERNENRTGRAYVPRSAIRRMHSQFTIPSDHEKYKYHVLIAKEK